MTQRNTTKIVLASAARTDSGSPHVSDDLDNLQGKGVEVIIDITAISGVGATLTVTLQSKDGPSQTYNDLLVSAGLTATGQTRLVVYPGVAESANVAASTIVGRTWRASAAITGTTPSVTFSIGASIIG